MAIASNETLPVYMKPALHPKNLKLVRALPRASKDEIVEAIRSPAGKNNAATIASIIKSVVFVSEEIKETKKNVKKINKEVTRLQRENIDLKAKVMEAERYKHQWGLRISSYTEK